jgi:hypothetical protein
MVMASALLADAKLDPSTPIPGHGDSDANSSRRRSGRLRTIHAKQAELKAKQIAFRCHAAPHAEVRVVALGWAREDPSDAAAADETTKPPSAATPGDDASAAPSTPKKDDDDETPPPAVLVPLGYRAEGVLFNEPLRAWIDRGGNHFVSWGAAGDGRAAVSTPPGGAPSTKEAVRCIVDELKRRVDHGVCAVLPPLPPPVAPIAPRRHAGDGSSIGGGARAKNNRACGNCGTTSHATPLMRRGPNGVRSLCNACGLWFARRGTMRPVEGAPAAPERPEIAAAAQDEEGAIVARKDARDRANSDDQKSAAANAGGVFDASPPQPATSGGSLPPAPASPSRTTDPAAPPASESSGGDGATVKSEGTVAAAAAAAATPLAVDAQLAAAMKAENDAYVAAMAKHAVALAAHEKSEKERALAYVASALHAMSAETTTGDGVFGYADAPVQQALLALKAAREDADEETIEKAEKAIAAATAATEALRKTAAAWDNVGAASSPPGAGGGTKSVARNPTGRNGRGGGRGAKREHPSGGRGGRGSAGGSSHAIKRHQPDAAFQARLALAKRNAGAQLRQNSSSNLVGMGHAYADHGGARAGVGAVAGTMPYQPMYAFGVAPPVGMRSSAHGRSSPAPMVNGWGDDAGPDAADAFKDESLGVVGGGMISFDADLSVSGQPQGGFGDALADPFGGAGDVFGGADDGLGLLLDAPGGAGFVMEGGLL